MQSVASEAVVVKRYDEAMSYDESDPEPMPVVQAHEFQDWDVPNQCETFYEEINRRGNGKVRWRRNRKGKLTHREQRRMQAVIDLVAGEMGADPTIFKLWAVRESSFRYSAIHVLNPDKEANRSAFSRFTYSDSRDRELTERIEGTDAQDPDYWKATAERNRRRTYRIVTGKQPTT